MVGVLKASRTVAIVHGAALLNPLRTDCAGVVGLTRTRRQKHHLSVARMVLGGLAFGRRLPRVRPNEVAAVVLLVFD